jgi:hypothetical protein
MCYVADLVSTSLLESFELLAHAEQLLPRLDAAAAEVAKIDGLSDERGWIDLARGRLEAAYQGTASDLRLRALRIPELQSLKGEHSRDVQGAVVDALEHLHAAITFAGGPRAALLEALYYRLKIPALRKCNREELEAFWADFEKRVMSTYARRMLADPDYAAVGVALQGLRDAFETWKAIFVAEPASGEEASALGAELELAASRLVTPLRQAKLLAQAALAPLKELDVAALLALKVKKRAKNAEDEDTHPLLENDPPDRREPTLEEAAEIELVRQE